MFQSWCVLSPRKRWVAGTLVACLLVAAPGNAGETGQITGVVQDATGARLAGVAITLRGSIERVVRTDGDGRFIIQQLPEDEYELTAVMDRFVPAVRTVRVHAGGTEPLVLTMSVG